MLLAHPPDTGDPKVDTEADRQVTERLVKEVWEMFWDDKAHPNVEKAKAFR